MGEKKLMAEKLDPKEIVSLEEVLLVVYKLREALAACNGGSVWESNPPCPLLAGNTGFEVQEGHQNLMHSHRKF